MKAYPNCNMILHGISGFLIVSITLFFGIEAWSKVGWKVLDLPHCYLAFTVMFGSTIIMILGIASRMSKMFCKWNTRTVLVVTYVHKSFAYLVMLCGFIAIHTGIHDYRTNEKRKGP